MTVAPPVLDLTDRHVLLTGGSRGLGEAMTRAIAAAGARVTATTRHHTEAARITRELAELGLTGRGEVMDVTDAASVDAAFARARDAFGTVTGLVNNAGVSIGGAAIDMPQATFATTMATNLDGTWHCSRAFARQLDGTDLPASIVNIGSMSASIVNKPRWQAPYLASKAAVHQLTKALAAEWAPRQIRVNALAPGYFLTEMSPVDQPEYHPYCVEPTPLQRWGEPHELGPAAVFLLSDASSFMTGAVMTIDGGYTLH